MKKLFTCLCLLGVISVFLCGCNTIEGMGKDIERGGQEIQKAAD
jgi:predicted small secreted protein